jgi:hypothetical protein
MRRVKLNSKASQASRRHTRHIKYSAKDGQEPTRLSPRFVSGRLSNTWGCGSEGERLTGSQKVVGSSPTSSTNRSRESRRPAAFIRQTTCSVF